MGSELNLFSVVSLRTKADFAEQKTHREAEGYAIRAPLPTLKTNQQWLVFFCWSAELNPGSRQMKCAEAGVRASACPLSAVLCLLSAVLCSLSSVPCPEPVEGSAPRAKAPYFSLKWLDSVSDDPKC